MQYETLRLVILDRRADAILVRKEGERSKNIWLAKINLIKGEKLDEKDGGFDIMNITAHRWVFAVEGLI